MRSNVNWWLKFAKGSESLVAESSAKNVDANKQLSSKFQPGAGISTPLLNSPYHCLLILLMAFVAFIVIIQIELRLHERIILMSLVLMKSGHDVFKLLTRKNFDNFLEIRIRDHQWYAVGANNDIYRLELLGISKIMGVGFVLKFSYPGSSAIRNFVIWSSRSTPLFIRYCQQISRYGSARQDNNH